MPDHKLLDMWLAPDGAGEPMACLATSFTFNTDFFRDECLARFLGMRSAYGEDGVSTVAQVNELEERLAQVTATAIVDRSARVESRNLRWDLLPVIHRGGLLHSKTAMLVWTDAVRIIIGSANLTSAGYRTQQEIAVAFDLVPDGPVPRSFWDDYATELRRILALVPDDLSDRGPKLRAGAAIDLLEARIGEVAPGSGRGKTRIVLVPSRPGEPALDGLARAMSGAKPRALTAMSPFWDRTDAGPLDAVRALTGLLASRGEADAYLTVPLRVSEAGNLTNAPADLEQRVARPGVAASLWGVDESPGGEFRRLHAKAVLLESEDWVTLMVGSSNMTTAGLGLHPHEGHVELNVAYGAPQGSELAKALLKVLPESVPLEPDQTVRDEPAQPDEDELVGAVLPSGFLSAQLSRTPDGWLLQMSLDPAGLPAQWQVLTTNGTTSIADDRSPVVDGVVGYELPAGARPLQGIQVRWTDKQGEAHHADWIVNVAEPADLPLDDRLAGISVDLIVQALAMRRGDPTANLERLLERWADGRPAEASWHLDPLRAYDDSRALLRRMTSYGRALDSLARQLSRPAPTLSALSWRLTGVISPVRLAEGWVAQHADGDLPLEMAHFLLAELQVTMSRVDWATATQMLDQDAVAEQLAALQDRWRHAYAQLPPLEGRSDLKSYVRESRALNGA